VARDQRDTAISVERMIEAGNVKITDLLCVTAHGAHSMTQLVERPPADAGLGPHRHSGPVFGYVLQGRILFELEGEAPAEILRGCIFSPKRRTHWSRLLQHSIRPVAATASGSALSITGN
jgi:quercetin dioxygenase-like cupin family protein